MLLSSEEGEIILDHNYDGIKELDNDLPPWWLYGFYATIIFAAIYLARFHIFNADDQFEEYDIAYAEAQREIEAYKKTAKNLVDVNTVEVLTESADLNAGKAIFTQNCVACHKADGGGGIGPNLTDAHWILGGGIKNVFNTISEGGRAGKGMVPWKTELKPLEMAQVASYVLTFLNGRQFLPHTVDQEEVNMGIGNGQWQTRKPTASSNICRPSFLCLGRFVRLIFSHYRAKRTARHGAKAHRWQHVPTEPFLAISYMRCCMPFILTYFPSCCQLRRI